MGAWVSVYDGALSACTMPSNTNCTDMPCRRYTERGVSVTSFIVYYDDRYGYGSIRGVYGQNRHECRYGLQSTVGAPVLPTLTKH